MNINYLRGDVVNKVKFYTQEFSRSSILNKVSRCLGYKNFGHLKREFEIDDSGNIICSGNDEGHYLPKLRIDLFGFIFNEYHLMKEFKLNFETAARLKKTIDSPMDISYRYDGNIWYCTKERYEFGLNQVINGLEHRIMASYPIKFYCKLQKSSTVTVGTKTYISSFVWFDELDVCDTKYFFNSDGCDFLIEMIDRILDYENVVIYSSVFKYSSNILSKALSHFESYKVKLYNPENGKDAIFLPSLRADKSLNQLL